MKRKNVITCGHITHAQCTSNSIFFIRVLYKYVIFRAKRNKSESKMKNKNMKALILNDYNLKKIKVHQFYTGLNKTL